MFFRECTLRNTWLEKCLKSQLRRPFDKLQGKRSQTLMKSEGQHLYDIY